MEKTNAKSLFMKLTFSYQDSGFEPICDLLLGQESAIAQTRMFRNLVIRAWHKALPIPLYTSFFFVNQQLTRIFLQQSFL